jgi:hypothetical protein
MFSPTAADMQAKFAFERSEAAFERAKHARGNARGVPIHSHHGAKGLEPERVREAAEEFIAPVVMNDGLRNNRAKLRHSLSQPFRHLTVVQRQVSASRAAHLVGLLARRI